MKKFFLFLFICFTGCIFHFSAFGQTAKFKVSGKITDALTNEPIPFANVAFKGTTVGTTSDLNGNYLIVTPTTYDTLSASFVGYQTVAMPVIKNKSQVINFSLKINKIDLPEIVIKPGENPAHVLLKKIIDNKEKNDKERLSAYQYEVYNKVEFDINNITEKFKKKKILKPFAFVFENVDSEATNKKSFLPVFISESLSDFYFRKNPKEQKEIIKASKVSGVENESVTQFLGDMYQNTNIYENFVRVFGKSFVSPIANFGLLYYKYYLVDSAFFGDKWCYKITFKPRRTQELTFVGDFWVHDTTFAIKKINARIANDANINFVEDLAVIKEYEFIHNQQWMLKKDLLVVNFVAKEEGMSFIGRKSTSYKKFILDQPKPEDFFLKEENVIVTDSAFKQDMKFWNEARHDSLSIREKKIYAMVDTLKSIPAFKTYIDVIILLTTGYKEFGKIDIGPYFTMYSFNEIEENRFRLGGKTNYKFSTKLYFDGYVAYGTKDTKVKYKGGVQYFFSKKPQQSVGFSYKNDQEQLGKSDNAFLDDNFLGSILRRIPATKRTTIEETKLFYEMEWIPGFSNRLGFTHCYYIPIGSLDYSYFTDDTKTITKNSLNISEISFYTRFAYHEKFVAGKKKRTSLGSKYPILQVNYVLGLKDVLGSNFTYHKGTLKVKDNVPLAPFGKLYYYIEAEKIWGTLPYPILVVHQGNETYTYDQMAFNLMNYYEFVSDMFASISLTHHFEGFFLDKIPLMRKLKWREVLTCKGVIGDLSDKNKEILLDPTAFSTMKKPYFEAGVGIENILKIIRVDAIWRLSYIDKQYVDNYKSLHVESDIAKFGIRASLQIRF